MATAGLRHRRGGRRVCLGDPATGFTVQETMVTTEEDARDPDEFPDDWAWCASWAIAWLREQSARVSSQLTQPFEIDHEAEAHRDLMEREIRLHRKWAQEAAAKDPVALSAAAGGASGFEVDEADSGSELRRRYWRPRASSSTCLAVHPASAAMPVIKETAEIDTRTSEFIQPDAIPRPVLKSELQSDGEERQNCGNQTHVQAAQILNNELQGEENKLRADSEVWDMARVESAKRVLNSRKAWDGRYRGAEMDQLSPDTLSQMLLPKGYVLPDSLVNELGEGMFGHVLMVRRLADMRILAAKRQFLGDVASEVVPVLRETTILKALRGARNIVHIEDSFLVRTTADKSAEIWSILEFFPHNLRDMKFCFQIEEWARHAVFQVLSGLHAMHSADIIHRDLKEDNLLVDFGEFPPQTLRVAICDFGVARSIHDFPATHGKINLRRSLTDNVGNLMGEPPEMSGWADTSCMTKRDLKSRDVFALGIIWANLLAGECVFDQDLTLDPPNYRLLETLQKVDRPALSDLTKLKFTYEVSMFVRAVLSGELAPIRAEMLASQWPQNQERRKELLEKEPVTIDGWVSKRSKDCASNSDALHLLVSATRFSYDQRSSVEELLQAPYFDDLCTRSPPTWWEHQDAPHVDDVGEALTLEATRQLQSKQRLRELTPTLPDLARPRSSRPLDVTDVFRLWAAINYISQIEASIGRVSDQVRTTVTQVEERIDQVHRRSLAAVGLSNQSAGYSRKDALVEANTFGTIKAS